MQTFSQYGRWLPIYICWIAGIILGWGAELPCRAQEPSEQRGILYLHGGGYVSDSQREQFTELAGGAKAKIVIIPTADVSTPLDPVRIHDWQRTRPADVQLLHAENRQQRNALNFLESWMTRRECGLVEANKVIWSGCTRIHLC